MKQNSNKGINLWIDYCEAGVGSGIPEKTAELYANWARKFAIVLKEKPLRLRSSEDVYSFLADYNLMIFLYF